MASSFRAVHVLSRFDANRVETVRDACRGLARIGCGALRIRAGVGLLEASCAATAEALSDRLEDELRGLRRLRVARHLTRCGRCRATLASLARLVQMLHTAREVEADNRGSLVADVLARIGEGSSRDGVS